MIAGVSVEEAHKLMTRGGIDQLLHQWQLKTILGAVPIQILEILADAPSPAQFLHHDRVAQPGGVLKLGDHVDTGSVLR